MLGLFNRWSHRRFKDLLSLYIDRRLDEPQTTALEEHLATCALCREELHTLRATVTLLHALPRAFPGRSFALTEQPRVSRAAPAYLWGMRAATAMASVALVLLVAGDLLGAFSRGIVPTGEVGQNAVEKGASDAVTPVTEEGAEAKSAPQSLASEAASPQTDFAAIPDASLPQIETETEETLPMAALEVAFGSVLALLALATLFATWQFKRRNHLA